MKNIITIFSLSITILLIMNSCTKAPKQFEDLKPYREEVVSLILEKQIHVSKNGLISLPDKLKYISDSGECLLVTFEGKTAIYFYSYRGLLESTKGYLFVTDKLVYGDYCDKNNYNDFVNVTKIDDNWYSCATN